MFESPCYNQQTHEDCPRRSGGCSVGCPEWDAYLKKRDKVYHERKIASMSDPIDKAGKSRRKAKWQKKYKLGSRKFTRH